MINSVIKYLSHDLYIQVPTLLASWARWTRSPRRPCRRRPSGSRRGSRGPSAGPATSPRRRSRPSTDPPCCSGPSSPSPSTSPSSSTTTDTTYSTPCAASGEHVSREYTAISREALATLPESSSRPLQATLAQSRNLAHASLKTAVWMAPNFVVSIQGEWWSCHWVGLT